ELHQAIGRVSRKERHDAGGQEVEGGLALAASDGEAHGDRKEQHIHQRIGDRDQLDRYRERVVVGVGGHQEGPGEEPDDDRDDQRVDQAVTVATGVAAMDEYQDPRDQTGVDAEVEDVPDRRERDVGVEELRVVVGDDVARDEERL